MENFIKVFLMYFILFLIPILALVSYVLDYIEDRCFLSGHSWFTNETYMRPVRQCRKCGQVQVKLPQLDKVTKGGWVNHDSPLNKGD